MNVEQLMSKNVKACTPNDTLEAAARIMWEHDCGAVPVVDGEGRCVAMVTDRDICMAGYTQGMQYWQIPVSVAASKTLFSVRPDDSMVKAEEMMRVHQVRRLPVIDAAGKLVGLLSLTDLARHAGRRSDDVASEEVSRTLFAICQRHHPASVTSERPT